MRIAYDHQIFAAQQYGGISRYFVEVAGRLSAVAGVHARVLALAHINKHLENASPGLVIGGRIDARRSWACGAFNALAAPIGLALFRPSIVHETYYSERRLAPSSARVVVTVYDMIHELYPASFPPDDKTAARKAAAVERADHVICISENTRQDLLRLLNVPAAKTSVVPLGWSLQMQGPENPVAVDGPYLLYVGNRGGYKNFGRLLEAYAASARLRTMFKLVVFGGGPWTDEERAAISRFGLDSAQLVQFTGSDRILAALYREATVFVYPSLYEGFGIPPLEAMALGCPVACGNNSSLPEVVGPAAAQFNASEAASIQATLEQIVDAPALRSSLQALGRQRVELFSWDRCARETLSIYRRLAAIE
jgi:glycosyltransferase involved in cell wall biosynthesis